MSYTVYELLKLDAEFRNTHKNRDPPLIYMNALSSPHIKIKDRTVKSVKNNSYQDAKQALFEAFPRIAELNMTNILIAGGSVSSALTCRHINEFVQDLDIFIYGIKDLSELNRKLKEIVENLIRATTQFCVIRTENTTNVIIGTEKYQIIHRGYSFASEILYGFDLGSCAMGWNGNDFVFSLMGCVAFSNHLNIVDTTRRSKTFEVRLSKYLDRGFEIVLPFLMNVDVKSFLITKNIVRQSFDKRELSDYESWELPFISDGFLINYVVKVKDQNTKIYLSENKYKALASSYSWRNRVRDLNFVCRHSSIETLIGFLNDKIKPPELFDLIILPKVVNTLGTLLESPVSWNITEPSTQISGSFNPINEPPQMWYGDYFDQKTWEQYL